MATEKTPPTEYLPVAHVAAVLGLSRMTVYRMCHDGTLPHIRTGRAGKTYRIPRSELDALRTAVTAPAPVSPGQLSIAETGAPDRV